MNVRDLSNTTVSQHTFYWEPASQAKRSLMAWVGVIPKVEKNKKEKNIKKIFSKKKI